MAHQEHVFPTRQLAFVELYGRVDRSELLSMLQALRKKGWKPDFKVLCSATSVRELLFRPGDLEMFITALKQNWNGCHHQREEQHRKANSQTFGLEVIVVQRPMDYSVALLYKELAARSGIPVKVCWSRKKAFKRLGLNGQSEALKNPFIDDGTP